MSGRVPGKADCRSSTATTRRLTYAGTCTDPRLRPSGAPKSWLHASIPGSCLFIPASLAACHLTTIWAEYLLLCLGQRRRSEQLPIAQIARVLGISRNSVRATLASDGPPKYRRAPARPVADSFEPRIRELLAAFASMPSTVIAERTGWPNSIRTLSGEVAQLRPVYLPPDPASRISPGLGGPAGLLLAAAAAARWGRACCRTCAPAPPRPGGGTSSPRSSA